MLCVKAYLTIGAEPEYEEPLLRLSLGGASYDGPRDPRREGKR